MCRSAQHELAESLQTLKRIIILVQRPSASSETLAANQMKGSVILYTVFTILAICKVFVYFRYGLSVRGYWSDKIFIWGWLIFTIYLIVRYFRSRLAKAYLICLILILVLSVIPFGIPLFIFVTSVTALDRSSVIRVTPNIRIERGDGSPMIGELTQVIHEHLLFERVVGTLPNQMDTASTDYTIEQAKSIDLINHTKDSFSLRINFPTRSVIEKFPQ